MAKKILMSGNKVITTSGGAITFDIKDEQEKTVTPTANGVVVTPDTDYTLSKVTVNGDSNLTASNIKSGTKIFGITGTYSGAKTEQTKTVDLTMSSGNQTIVPDSGKVLSKVVVNKPSTLVPENIKKDVNIGGVVGTLESGSSGGGISKITLTSNFPAEYGGLGIYAVNPSTGNYTAHVLSAPGKLTVDCLGGVPFVIYGVDEGGGITNVDWGFFFSNEQYYELFSEYDVALPGIENNYGIILPSGITEFFATSLSQLFVFPSTVKDFNFVYNFEE